MNLEHIKQHYYGSHVTIDAMQVVPLGPKQEFVAPA